ncbi:MAG TPA: tRNA (N(6)-L-threonylcarbamoyladenosine(37)-C(2))-methylthiotransferase MtaB [Dongiaceae bacterium]|jgi:threonylcarbamoyladenosine tRNA methylthiotransferase MtaB|nr:tRNA (N(6)-L-threonylcarbamoyladenosine(37)-C(2))-methylthiotransferase MtaB [Dongiaceae bacterium]
MVEIVTLGCRLNAFESEVMRAHAAKAGLDGTIIVNSCAVTAEAERQTRQEIRRARRRAPDAQVVVTGCAAQIAPEKYAAMAEVDAVLGNAEKLEEKTFHAMARTTPPRLLAGDIMQVREGAHHLIPGFAERARAFVEIQQGCDHRCTFCIIPYGRGNSRSVPLGAIIEQARRLVAEGYQEIVLTGVDITSYGNDLPGRIGLGQLVRRLLALVPDLGRLRLSSLDVAECDETLIAAIAAEPRLMPHLHLSLQAGNDLILKRMKRRHSRAQAIAFCARLRALRPDVVFGADFIAGFPTEDEAMFADTIGLVEECGLTSVHVFPYSPRSGTPAVRMPQVPAPERKHRARRLRSHVSVRARAYYASRVGSHASILIERSEGGEAFGHDEYFVPVRLRNSDASPGEIRVCSIVAADAEGLLGA